MQYCFVGLSREDFIEIWKKEATVALTMQKNSPRLMKLFKVVAENTVSSLYLRIDDNCLKTHLRIDDSCLKTHLRTDDSCLKTHLRTDDDSSSITLLRTHDSCLKTH